MNLLHSPQKQGKTRSTNNTITVKCLAKLHPKQQKSSAVNSESEDNVATSKAAKTAYDKAVEAKTTADGKVGLNGNESINGEQSFENRIVAKRNIRISDSQHYASRGDYLNIGANNGDCWFEYKSSNREIDTLRMHANGDLTYKRQKSTTLGQNPNLIRILKASLIHLQAMVLGILK